MLQSGKEMEITTNKRDEGKDIVSEFVTSEKEGESTPPTDDVVKEEKEELYVLP